MVGCPSGTGCEADAERALCPRTVGDAHGLDADREVLEVQVDAEIARFPEASATLDSSAKPGRRRGLRVVVNWQLMSHDLATHVSKRESLTASGLTFLVRSWLT